MKVSNILIAPLILSSKCVSSTSLSRDSSVRGGHNHQESGSRDDSPFRSTLNLFLDDEEFSVFPSIIDYSQSNEVSPFNFEHTSFDELLEVTGIDQDAFGITSDHDQNYRDNQDGEHIRGKHVSEDSSSDDTGFQLGDYGVIQGDIVMADTVSARGTKGHRGRKSRFQNKHKTEETETAVAAHIAVPEDEELIEEELIKEEILCLWSGMGCDGDCDEDEMKTFCSKLETMEKCNGTKDEELKCVWAQKVAEEESLFFMDILMASRRRSLKFHVIGLVILTMSLLWIGLAVVKMTQWWKYRGYTKLADDAEGDLLATIL